MAEHYSKHYLPWLKDARCASDPESVRDAYGDDNDPDEMDTKDAQAFANYHCLNCPAMVECLRDAVVNNETKGVRGGFLPSERVGMKLGEGVLK